MHQVYNRLRLLDSERALEGSQRTVQLLLKNAKEWQQIAAGWREAFEQSYDLTERYARLLGYYANLPRVTYAPPRSLSCTTIYSGSMAFTSCF